MADALEAMLTGAARGAGEHATAAGSARCERLDDVLDRLNTAIKAYLTALDPEALTEADHRRLSQSWSSPPTWRQPATWWTAT